MTKDDAIKKLTIIVRSLTTAIDDYHYDTGLEPDEELYKHANAALSFLDLLSRDRAVKRPESHAVEVIKNFKADDYSSIQAYAAQLVDSKGLFGNDGPSKAWTESVIVRLINKGLL